jgi:hypothetical protein
MEPSASTSMKRTGREKNPYIDRSYPIQPYTALVFDFLLDVGQAAVIMAI